MKFLKFFFFLTLLSTLSLQAEDGTKNSRFLNIGVNKNMDFDLKKGEELYAKECKSCHGDKGEKRAMAVSKRLSTLSAQDIEASFISYRNDPTYGGRAKMVMSPVASRVSFSDLGYIIAYLKGQNAFMSEDNSEIQTTPTTQGVYIE